MSASDKNRGLGPADRAATAPRPEEIVDDGSVRGAGMRSRSAAVQGSDSTPGTCDTIETALEEVAFRGQEPAGDLREHLVSCQRCADRFKRETALYRMPPEVKGLVFDELGRLGAFAAAPGAKPAWRRWVLAPIAAVVLALALFAGSGIVTVLGPSSDTGGHVRVLGPKVGSPLVPNAPQKTAVVVAASNDTGDPELDGVSGLFITSLQQSELLAPLRLEQMHGLDRSDVKRIDEALGRDVARQTQAKALLLISIRRYDRVYVIDVKAVDPSSERYLFALREEGTDKSSIPGMIDRLSDRVRHLMREGRQSTVREAGDPPAGPAAR